MPALGGLAAHGVGGRQDLPIPFEAALIGAGVAVLATFVVLAVAWREPRRPGSEAGAPLPAGLARVLDAPATRWVLRLLGLAVTAYCVLGLFGPDLATNPTAGVVFVLLWVAVPLLSALLGPVWRLVSPLRTLQLLVARAALVRPDRGLLPLGPAVGVWPAALGLLAFVWLELVAPDRATLPVLRLAIALYVVVVLGGAVLLGARWFAAADPLEAWSSLLGRLAPLGRRGDGRLVLRDPVSGLDTTPIVPGLAAVVVVLLGSTAYDSISAWPRWVRVTQSSSLPDTALGTLGLLGAVGFVAITYVSATLLSGRGGDVPLRELPDRYAPSVVPIALGYVVAHYLTLLVFEGQRTLILLSDPLGTGADWLGTAERGVDMSLADAPTAVSTIQVLAVVLGHVVGIIAAHDRAVRLLPRKQALAGQVPLVAVMVLYTVGGLWLLFAA